MGAQDKERIVTHVNVRGIKWDLCKVSVNGCLMVGGDSMGRGACFCAISPEFHDYDFLGSL